MGNGIKTLKKRKKDTHKGDYGHIFILAGSRGMSGAGALCSKASLRAGAGLVTLGIPSSLSNVMARKLTEVMTYALDETKECTLAFKAKSKILKKVKSIDVAVMGPGLSQNTQTMKLVRSLITSIDKKMVIDADALNALKGHIEILKRTKAECIITPHPGEMARLIGKSTDYIKKHRLKVAKAFSSKYNTIVLLKGYNTVVVDKKNVYINKTGNPGMATAGSGDVLTGIISGFLAQGLKSFNAAKLGCYVHGLAGDKAAKEKGEVSLIAGDILEKIPEAIKALQFL